MLNEIFQNNACIFITALIIIVFVAWMSRGRGEEG